MDKGHGGGPMHCMAGAFYNKCLIAYFSTFGSTAIPYFKTTGSGDLEAGVICPSVLHA